MDHLCGDTSALTSIALINPLDHLFVASCSKSTSISGVSLRSSEMNRSKIRVTDYEMALFVIVYVYVATIGAILLAYTKAMITGKGWVVAEEPGK